MSLPQTALIEKPLGQTPLECMEAWRHAVDIDQSVPLTYAGRLDPMATGTLLILVGEECKQKDKYLALDKTYEFSVLLGIGSDTYDILGRLHTQKDTTSENLTELSEQLETIVRSLEGDIQLPYPPFSSKTVHGRPLFTWALENRLHEIDIPTKSSTIYNLTLDEITCANRKDIATRALEKISTVTEVTDHRKTLGSDFRRTEVQADWRHILSDQSLPRTYHIASFTCTASSGTYMRALARLIGERLLSPTSSLAWSIHRTKIYL